MKTSSGLSGSNPQRDLLLQAGKSKHAPTAKSVSRVAHAGGSALDIFDREPQRLRVRLRSGELQMSAQTVREAGEGAPPCRVTFATHDDIDKRFSQENLWVPPMNGRAVATLYLKCGMLVVREAGKTFGVEQAAGVVSRMLRPMAQMATLAQMRVFEAFLANVLVVDESLREALKAEQYKRWDRQDRARRCPRGDRLA